MITSSPALSLGESNPSAASQSFCPRLPSPFAHQKEGRTATSFSCLLALVCLSLFLMPTAGFAQYTWKTAYTGGGGGFVPGIVFSEAAPNVVYLRTDIGGAYRRDPVTRRWIPITDHLSADDWNLTGIISLAPDPVNANVVYLAAGTYTNNWTNQNGAILKSTDQGATWTRTMLPFKVGGNMPGRGSGERLAVDPNNNSVLYFCGGGNGSTTFGLWKSTDAGVSWSQVTSFSAVGNWREASDGVDDPASQYQGLWWVVFDKRTVVNGVSQNIYVGVATKTGPTVWRSSDGGSTWAAVPGQPAVGDLMPKKAKFDHVNGLLYVAYGQRAGPYSDDKGDVYKYNTATNGWTLISPMPYADVAFGYNGLDIDRQNPNVIMVTGYSCWWPDTMIWRSYNGGQTWSRIWDWTSYPDRSYRYVANSSGGVGDVTSAPWLDNGVIGAAPSPNPKVGWMTEGLAIDPFNSNHFLYGTGMTVFGADDLLQWDPATTNQIHLKAMAQGIEEMAVLDVISPPVGPPLLTAVGDVIGFKHDDLNVAPTKWFLEPAGWSTSMGLDYAELNPTFIVRCGYGSPGTSKSVATSTDSGATWVPWSGQEPNGFNGDGGTIAVNATGSRLLWAPGNVAVQTAAVGGNWAAAAGLPLGTDQRPAICSDRANPNRFYAFADSTFYYSVNGGFNFTASPAAGFPPASVKIKAVAGREGDVWLASSATSQPGLWRTTDGGLTFTKLANVEAADSVGFGAAGSGQTYPTVFIAGRVGGIRGIFASVNAGATWNRINDDQHQYGGAGQAGITGDPRVYGRVYLTTNGRGAIYGDGDPAGGGAITIPAAPSALTATAASSSQINLSWTDNASNETNFELQQATNSTFSSGLVTTTLAANTTTASATGLAASTTYYFRVRATNSAGASSYSNTANATTQAGGGAGIMVEQLLSGSTFSIRSSTRGAQSFVIAGTGMYQVTKLTLRLSRKNNTSASLNVNLSTGLYGTAVAGSSVSVPASAVGTSLGSVDVVFSTPVTLSKGTTYYINLTSSTGNNAAYTIATNSANPYAGGAYFSQNTNTGNDAWFQVWGQ